MRSKVITAMCILVFIIGGCTNTNSDGQKETNKESPNSDPISFETQQGKKNQGKGIREHSLEEQPGYPQHDQDNVNHGEANRNNADIFTTQEAEEISRHLTKRRDITQAQVATTEDRVIIGLILKKQQTGNQQLIDNIEKEVQQFAPDKEIIVYTDDTHWNKMKNLDRGLKRNNSGEDVESYIENFFGNNGKD